MATYRRAFAKTGPSGIGPINVTREFHPSPIKAEENSHGLLL